jgi:dihydrofolate synthase/folylpolyglutamate synthase
LTVTDTNINQLLDQLLNLHPKKIDLSLDRVNRLLAKLGNPHKKINSPIWIAGSNGKFSTLKFIQSILLASGKTSNAYISPHLVKFNERFELENTCINNEELFSLLNQVIDINAKDEITFFEATNSAFFLAASKRNVDFNLIEVGLGGRSDSTAVIEPEISVISSVSMDHQDFLGDTIEKIAYEKAGIIRKHVPVVIGYQPFVAAKKVLIDYAHSTEAPTWIYDQDFFIFKDKDKLVYEDNDHRFKFNKLIHHGDLQIKNLGLAIATCLQLYKIEVKSYLQNNLHQNVVLPGRFQKLENNKLCNLISKQNELYLDGSHNPDAAYNVNQSLQSLPKKDLCIIIGMLNTKDPSEYIKQFNNIREIKTITIDNEDNAISAKELSVRLKKSDILTSHSSSIEDAIESLAEKYPTSRILICGSLYLVGQVLKKAKGTL